MFNLNEIDFFNEINDEINNANVSEPTEHTELDNTSSLRPINIEDGFLFLNNLESNTANAQIFCHTCSTPIHSENYFLIKRFHVDHIITYNNIRASHLHCKECNILYSVDYYTDNNGYVTQMLLRHAIYKMPCAHLKKPFEEVDLG